MVDSIKIVEHSYLKEKEKRPKFRIGDTVDVHVKIVEADKERIQIFNGTVIGRRGSGINETFTVRRIVAGEGVERIFPIHSPSVVTVEVVRPGKVRRAKLYYLRERVGKATKVKERREEAATSGAKASKAEKRAARKLKSGAGGGKAEGAKAAKGAGEKK